jgi:hypothetical protein
MLFRVVILAALLPLAFLGFGYSGTADAASFLSGVVGIAASCLSGGVFHSIASHISRIPVVADADRTDVSGEREPAPPVAPFIA